MDFSVLSRYDDILASYFVDSLYLWYDTLRMNGDFVGTTADKNETVNRLRQHIIGESFTNKAVKDAAESFLTLPYFKEFIQELPSKQVTEFTQHMKRYLFMYRPNAGFEVGSTSRYTGKPEACLLATKEWKAGEQVTCCLGSIAALSEQDDLKLKSEGRDFSVMVSTRKKCSCLFLGPARFMNHDCDSNCEFILIGQNAITFRVQKDIQIGEEMTVFYAEHYFGENNCECLCSSCEIKKQGHFSASDENTITDTSDSDITIDENATRRSGRKRKDISYKDYYVPEQVKKSRPGPPFKNVTNQIEPPVMQKKQSFCDKDLDPFRPRSNSLDSLSSFYDWIDSLSDISDDEEPEQVIPTCCPQAKEYCTFRLRERPDLCGRCNRHYQIYGLPWPMRKIRKPNGRSKKPKESIKNCPLPPIYVQPPMYAAPPTSIPPLTTIPPPKTPRFIIPQPVTFDPPLIISAWPLDKSIPKIHANNLPPKQKKRERALAFKLKRELHPRPKVPYKLVGLDAELKEKQEQLGGLQLENIYLLDLRNRLKRIVSHRCVVVDTSSLPLLEIGRPEQRAYGEQTEEEPDEDWADENNVLDEPLLPIPKIEPCFQSISARTQLVDDGRTEYGNGFNDTLELYTNMDTDTMIQSPNTDTSEQHINVVKDAAEQHCNAAKDAAEQQTDTLIINPKGPVAEKEIVVKREPEEENYVIEHHPNQLTTDYPNQDGTYHPLDTSNNAKKTSPLQDPIERAPDKIVFRGLETTEQEFRHIKQEPEELTLETYIPFETTAYSPPPPQQSPMKVSFILQPTNESPKAQYKTPKLKPRKKSARKGCPIAPPRKEPFELKKVIRSKFRDAPPPRSIPVIPSKETARLCPNNIGPFVPIEPHNC